MDAIVKLRDDSGTNSKELQITCLRKDIKELEQRMEEARQTIAALRQQLEKARLALALRGEHL